jgi:predicted nucleotidyltransferase
MPETQTVDIEALRRFFQKDPNVVLASLFGSSSDGTVSPGSDIDIAVLYDEPPEPLEEYNDYYLRLCDVTEDIAPISLVNLNTADPILAFEALSGRIICKNNPEKAAEYQSLICRQYEDVMGNIEHQRRMNEVESSGKSA